MRLLFLCILLLGAAMTASSFPPAATAAEDTAAAIEFKGVVTAWQLNMDGTIYIRLRGSPPAEDGREVQDTEIWFRTPPDQSSVISVEEMMMAIVLNAQQSRVLTLVAEGDTGRDGSRPRAALEIRSVAKL